jgi:CHAT domain-containing protein
VVAVPVTAGQPALDGADIEAAELVTRFRDTLGLVGPEATRAAVLAALPQRPWVHFACHGTQDISDPSAGRLLLHDGPLTIREISGLHLDRAEFGFLSACQTSRGGIELADEVISVGSALQLAGYRHVIGTLWSISDSDAPEVARDVYAGLARDGALDVRALAAALDEAIRRLRARYPTTPSRWAAYIHVGP